MTPQTFACWASFICGTTAPPTWTFCQPWESYLSERISMMLERTDQASYEQTLAFFGTALQSICHSRLYCRGGLELLSGVESDYEVPV